jgi:hypothetical protein
MLAPSDFVLARLKSKNPSKHDMEFTSMDAAHYEQKLIFPIPAWLFVVFA